MIEHQTEAIVLAKAPADNADAYYTLLTADLGKVNARATSVRKLTSRLAGHLEPGTLAIVRLVQRVPGGPRRLVEALAKAESRGVAAMKIVSLADDISPPMAPDSDFFEAVKTALFNAENRRERIVLKAAGFDPDAAKCAFCGSDKLTYFSGRDIIFLCQACYQKINQREGGGVLF